MLNHDIIDNRNDNLVDDINQILESSDSARFAVGYFFVSGLQGIAQRLRDLKELRLLIGNTTNRDTLEQLVEGYRRLDLVANAAEAQAYPKRSEIRHIKNETAYNVRSALELMDQTDEAESLVGALIRMIEEKRLKVRVYTKGRMEARAYIFDQKGNAQGDNGIAIVGSSNLTLSGLSHDTQLNVVVRGNDNHTRLMQWFDSIWGEAQDFDETLMREMCQSWASATTRPYDVYMKTLYSLVKDRLDSDADNEVLWEDEITTRLADFQKAAVKRAVQKIRDHGGVFISDVVGLGKSYIGAAIVKHFERTQHARPLIICPAPLQEMWERYNEVYQLNARVLSMGLLRENSDQTNFMLEDVKYRDRDFVLIDESHHLRHPNTQRYKILESFLGTGRRCCFLTATPRNKSAWDVYHQVKLFHQDDKTDLPIDPADIKEHFKLIDSDQRQLQDFLVHLLIRRRRKDILKWYGYDAQTHEKLDPTKFQDYADGKKRAYIIVGGKHHFFPRRELETITYSIEETYQGLYQQLREYLGHVASAQPRTPHEGELTYARYGLWHYVLPEKRNQEPYANLHRAGANLRGLMRVMLFKRFESSVRAFQETLRRLAEVHDRFNQALASGIVPAGEDAQQILYEPNEEEERDIVEALRQVSHKYSAEDFDLERLQAHIEHDIRMLREMRILVDCITPAEDAKLQTLTERISEPPLRDGKLLIFTQYADTARYLYENLDPNGDNDDIDVIYSSDKSKARIVGRFSPGSNPEYKLSDNESELNLVVATDVLAEGLNLQDCNKIINYDLHWNPVKLIQRFGRIDRIGSEHDVIYGFNFLPETGIETNLGLRQRLRNRIQEIHDTIGEDSAILDQTEQLNEDAMYAIYEKHANDLSRFEDEDEDYLDLSEAEEILREIQHKNPTEYERITSLRDGIRSAMTCDAPGLYVFCEANYPDRPELKGYQQLFLVDESGNIVSRDIPRILGMIKCTPETKSEPLPKGLNGGVMRVKKLFTEEVKHRHSERAHTTQLTQSQRYVLRELRLMFSATNDEDVKGQINILEKAFRGPITTAVNRELNLLRRNGVRGDGLLKSVTKVYHQHSLRDWLDRRSNSGNEQPVAKIVCSEALI